MFVHGFGGDALASWQRFANLAPADIRWAARPAEVLNLSLDALAPELPQCRRPDGFGYENRIIVAHSLGGLITRRVTLEAFQRQRPWLRGTRVVLFAPAHTGAHVIPLAITALTDVPALGNCLAAGIEYAAPALDGLKPGCDAITKLQARTEAAMASGAGELAP